MVVILVVVMEVNGQQQIFISFLSVYKSKLIERRSRVLKDISVFFSRVMQIMIHFTDGNAA